MLPNAQTQMRRTWDQWPFGVKEMLTGFDAKKYSTSFLQARGSAAAALSGPGSKKQVPDVIRQMGAFVVKKSPIPDFLYHSVSKTWNLAVAETGNVHTRVSQ